MRTATCFLITVCLFVAALSALAESPETRPTKVDHFKIAASMFSDAQNWTDFQICDEVRLQNRTGTSAWRLLGAQGKVLLKGTREACQTRLGKLIEQRNLEPLGGNIVVLVHGLFQTRAKMESLEMHLKKSGELAVINFGYASTKGEIGAHAEALEQVLASAKPDSRVSFVGHSMGCIVIRELLGRTEDFDWKLGRVVMLGPPNQGAEMARRLSNYRFVRKLLGPGFEQLADPKLVDLKALQAPPCEFAVIAGASPKWMLNNPLIEGDDDWIVSLSETQLAGAKAQTCVNAHHGDIVHDPKVLELTAEFLKSGELNSKQPSEGK